MTRSTRNVNEFQELYSAKSMVYAGVRDAWGLHPTVELRVLMRGFRRRRSGQGEVKSRYYARYYWPILDRGLSTADSRILLIVRRIWW
jgi:hypothetical protein